jgi:hypothetical protein
MIMGFFFKVQKQYKMVTGEMQKTDDKKQNKNPVVL